MTAQTLTLTDGIAPFAQHTSFTLTPVTADGPLYTLTSTTPGGPEFVLIDPAAYFPQYTPEVPEPVVDALALTTHNAKALALVSIPASGAADATANLLAPVVLNVETGRAAQVVLTDGAYAVREPLHARR